MDKSFFLKQFGNHSNEELIDIVLSNESENSAIAVEAASELLSGKMSDDEYYMMINVSLEKKTDEELLVIIATNEERYSMITITIAEGILAERRHKIEAEKESKEITGSPIPFVISIVLLYWNSYMVEEIYTYQVTGKSSYAVDFAASSGLAMDILLRVIVIVIVVHFLKKQKSSDGLLTFAIIGSILVGAWALLLVGVMELMTKYPISEEVDNS